MRAYDVLHNKTECGMILKILSDENGVILLDKEMFTVNVIPFGEKGDCSEIYKKIGEAIYEEWKVIEGRRENIAFGVEIKVSFKAIEKDVLV